MAKADHGGAGTPRRARRALLLAMGAFLAGGMPAAHAATAPAEPGTGIRTATIPVEGMACVSCAASVKRTVKAINGVSDAEVSLVARTVRVTYAPDRLSLDRVVAAINRLGYKAGPLEAAP